MNNNSPIYTLYLQSTTGEEQPDGSWSWNVQWRSVFPAVTKYENYIMTHNFLQYITRDAIPETGTVEQSGLPLMGVSTNSGASNIINTWYYDLTTSNDATEDPSGFVGVLTCDPASSLVGGTKSLVNSVVNLKFRALDGTVLDIGDDFIHKFQFTPILNT